MKAMNMMRMDTEVRTAGKRAEPKSAPRAIPAPIPGRHCHHEAPSRFAFSLQTVKILLFPFLFTIHILLEALLCMAGDLFLAF